MFMTDTRGLTYTTDVIDNLIIVPDDTGAPNEYNLMVMGDSLNDIDGRVQLAGPFPTLKAAELSYLILRSEYLRR